MGRRIEHLKESKAYSEELFSHLSENKLPWYRNFYYWMHHPISNTRFRFWNSVPHKPKMEFEVASIGSVNHEYRDADVLYLFSSCRRCAFEAHEGTFVPFVADDETSID